MNRVFLLLGSNIGDRESSLKDATLLIEADLGDAINASSIYETEPWGFQSEDCFLNQALEVRTDLTPGEVLYYTSEIENRLGRKRNSDIYQNRSIDIDILFYNDLQIANDHLVIPHPKIHLRKFALVPLDEIACDFIHPVFKKKINELLKICDDDKIVKLIKEQNTISVNHFFAKDEI